MASKHSETRKDTMALIDHRQTENLSTPRWHAIDVGKVSASLASSIDGLTSNEALRRLDRFGPNSIAQEREATRLEVALAQVRSPLILLLLFAAVIMLAIGEEIDAFVILLVVIVNSAIGFVQESRAAQSVRALRDLLSSTARVLRDGKDVVIDAENLVPGDVVLLDSGTRVPADMRLWVVTTLLVDESLLTGESESVSKSTDALETDASLADRTNMVFAGTTVVRGRGRGMVVATGDSTELGSLAGEMREVEHGSTPLQLRLNALARTVGIIVVLCAAIAFVAGVWSGRSTSEMFLVAVAVAVSAVPEGLPIAFTITLAVGVRHMARRNAIVRRLPVVETLGSTTIIGSDKTGTLTENRMTVQRIWANGMEVAVPGPESGMHPVPRAVRTPEDLTVAELTALCGAMTNEAQVSFDGGELQASGDPTESALIVSALMQGIDVSHTRNDWELVFDIPFEPERGFSATLWDIGDRRALFVKGAPELLMANSIAIQGDGECSLLDTERIVRAGRVMAAQGQRVLAMAWRPLEPDHLPIDPDIVPSDLVFLGLQGMTDPARHGAADAIKTCHWAGVRTIMITGDHQTTASAIAKHLQIAGTGEIAAMSGSQIATMTASDLEQAVRTVDVFSRVTPEQKLRIVQALQRNGEVVAVTGDGVNDAPALRASDVGVAMGKRGTDVAKEAADMVLADDNFVSIVSAMEEGRKTYDNVRKVVSFLFTTNVAEVLIIIAALLLDWPLPIIAVQILWLNLVTDSLQVMALAFEPAEPDIMTRPPVGRTAGILSRALWHRVEFSGVVMTIGTLALFRWELDNGTSEKEAQTLALTTMVLFQMFQALNSRSEKRSLLQMPFFGNRLLIIAILASVLLHAAALYLPPTQYLLR
ncbi:MAG: cation-translocating P-type ATPase, partial [Thermomicrobiales bacterium]